MTVFNLCETNLLYFTYPLTRHHSLENKPYLQKKSATKQLASYFPSYQAKRWFHLGFQLLDSYMLNIVVSSLSVGGCEAELWPLVFAKLTRYLWIKSFIILRRWRKIETKHSGKNILQRTGTKKNEVNSAINDGGQREK